MTRILIVDDQDDMRAGIRASPESPRSLAAAERCPPPRRPRSSVT
jgi:hypothetical protein